MSITGEYRSHTCGDLRVSHVGQHVKLSGWVYRKRDHGQLVFLDLRDHYGVTQCVLTSTSGAYDQLQSLKLESVITVEGTVAAREPENVYIGSRPARSSFTSTRSRCSPPRRRCRSSWLGRHSGGAATTLQVSRSATGEAHANIVLRSRVISTFAADDRRRVPRICHSDPDIELAGRRARLPRAQPHSPGIVLCAAAGAAAVQAAADGGGIRSILPDCSLFPGRRRQSRSIAWRVLSAGRRDVVRHPGGGVSRDRARHDRNVQATSSWPTDGGAVSTDSVCARARTVRHR